MREKFPSPLCLFSRFHDEQVSRLSIVCLFLKKECPSLIAFLFVFSEKIERSKKNPRFQQRPPWMKWLPLPRGINAARCSRESLHETVRSDLVFSEYSWRPCPRWHSYGRTGMLTHMPLDLSESGPLFWQGGGSYFTLHSHFFLYYPGSSEFRLFGLSFHIALYLEAILV